MRIFVTWSGELSKSVALAIRSWLPLVLHRCEVFVSDEDVAKGTRGLAEIAEELDKTDVGILCITRTNFDRPWVNFEAGAISKKVGKARLVPFLIDLQPHDLPRNSPLTQFQATVNTREDIQRMIESINQATDPAVMDSSVLSTLFDSVWNRLEEPIEEALAIAQTEGEPQLVTNTPDQMIAEVLDTVRNQTREIELLKEQLGPNAGRMLVYMDELPGIPDHLIDWFPEPSRDDPQMRRVLTKLYHAITGVGQREISRDEFRDFMMELGPVLSEGFDKMGEMSKDKAGSID